jgi:RHS repeat-associated protein
MNHFQVFRYIKQVAVLMLFFPLILRGQSSNSQIKDVVMPSPTTSAFAKYVDIPVSYHTGVPNISIPICNITDGSIELPISLNYHASGIKVAETASWVGLGWNISGVSQVSRTVMGYADEKDRGYLKDYLLGITKSPMLTPGGYTTVLNVGGSGETLSGAVGEGTDYEPDLFSFSAGNYSGKFYIHPTEGVILLPKQDLKIIYDNPTDGEFDYFRIVTPNGDKYHFGKVSTDDGGSIGLTGLYEYAAIPSNYMGYVDTKQTWYLVKIENANGNNSINLSYEKEIYNNSNRIPSSETKVGITNVGATPLSNNYNSVLTLGQTSMRLKTITNSTGTMEINFNANTIRDDIESSVDNKSKRLDEIVIKLGNTTDFTKKIIFSYDYLTDNSCNFMYCKRLRLTQLQEVSADNITTIPPHTFQYEGDNIFPNRYSKAVDHWGFYNGASSNNNLYLSIPSKGADREPNEINNKKGILKKITYPTGGTTDFLFESNTYLPFNTTVPKLCGGLRIKKISVSNGTQVTDTNFDYSGDNNFASSGTLVSKPTYEFIQEIVAALDYSSARIDLKTETTTLPLSDWNGYHIYYNKVTESKSGIGSTVYRYETEQWSSYNHNGINGNGMYPFKGSPIYMESDKVKSVTSLDNNGNIVNANVFDNKLSFIGTTANDLPAFRLSNFQIMGANAQGQNILAYAHFVNKIDLPKSFEYGRLRSKTETIDGVTTKTEYTYSANNYHNFPVEIKVTNSTGKIHKTQICYALDCNSETNATEFKNRFMIGVPLKTLNYIDGTLIGGFKTEYTLNSFFHFLPTRFYTLNKYASATLKTEIVSFNSKGLPTNKVSGVPSVIESYTWDTQNRLISKTLGDILSLNRLTSSIEYYGTTTLPKFITDENGLKKKFTYDGLQRFQKAQDRFLLDASGNMSDIQATATSTYQYKTPTIPYNYIESNATFKGILSSQISRQYIDGLGRPVMSQRTNGDNTYTKSYVTYDALGRQDKTYEPIVSNTEGVDANYLNPIGVLTGKAYTQPTYEASPLSRPTAQRNLDGTFVYMAYGTNTATEVLKFSVTSNANSDLDDVVAANGNYDVNSLMKTTITNENGKITQVFKDKMGRVVLTRKFLNGTNVDTYNVYDDYGQLVMVIPPDAINASNVIKLSLVFCYKYDNQNRLCRKQVPGADAQKFYYDARDLLTLTQDGNMRSTASGGNANKYLGTQYDDLGRVMKTGWITTATPLTTALNVTIADDANKLTETQYYKRDATTGLISATGALGSSWVKHQGARVLKPAGVTTPTQFVWSYVERRAGYEHTGNPMWTGKQHLLHTSMSQLPITDNDVYGVDWTVSAYNGAQKPTNSYHYLFGSSSITNGSQVREQQDFTYDAIQRLTEVKHTYALNGAGLTTPNVTLSNMVYNFKDQLTEKNIGRTGTGKYLQSIDYSYNVRGWLTGINSFGIGTSTGVVQQILTPSSTLNGTVTNLAVSPFIKQAMMTPPPVIDDAIQASPDLFSQNINYYNVDAAFQGAPQYNGNISATSWQVAGRAIQGYGYTYDDLDRMTEAKYFDITPPTGNVAGLPTSFSSDFKYNEKLTYDKRGNILTLERKGLNGGAFTSTDYTGATFGMIDNMTYTYNDKNQATTISDASMGNKGYKYYVSSPGDFRYDANGNLVYDRVKGISNIIYNYLNLPITIQMGSGTKIDFIYDASGAKLRKITTYYGTLTGVYDYVGGVEYKNNSLERISNTEGAVTKNINGIFEYEYALRDHLGNTRVTFKDKDKNGTVQDTDIVQINHYYPFGLNMEGNWTPKGANGEGNKYLYNGKELNEDFGLNWNDYGARFYDAAIGRWNAKDPLAEKFISHSPYTYVMNRPIIMIDPTGMAAVYNWETGKYEDGGKEVSFDQAMSSHGMNTDGSKQTSSKDGDEPISKNYQGKKEIAPADKSYNCHSYAWSNSKGDPSDPANKGLEYPTWDNDPLNNTSDYRPLDFNEPNKIGDRIMYFSSDQNNNIIATHSGIVTNIDKNGNASEITSKWGQAPVFQHHPRDVPSIYSNPEPTFKVDNKVYQSRVYFRNINSEPNKLNFVMRRDNTNQVSPVSRLTRLNTYTISPVGH